MLDEIKSQLMEYDIIAIKKENFGQVFEVYDTNQNFFLLVQGKEATIENSINDIDTIPPNCAIEQKIYISIWKNGNVVGVLDIIEKYPTQSCFWIGLLLIHSNFQGKKIGSAITKALLNAAKIAGYKTAQLGVIESNEKGVSFWKKHGFNILRHSDNIVVMVKDIG